MGFREMRRGIGPRVGDLKRRCKHQHANPTRGNRSNTTATHFWIDAYEMMDSSESARRGGSSAKEVRVRNGSGTGRRGDEFVLSEGERVEERSRSGELFLEEEGAVTSEEVPEEAGCWSDSDGRDIEFSLIEKVSWRFCTGALKSSCASLVPAAASTSSSNEASPLRFGSSSNPFSCK